MANHLYGYNPTSYGGAANLSSVYTSRSVADPYLSADSSLLSSSRYLTSDILSSSSASNLSSIYSSIISDRGPSSMLFSHTDALAGGYSVATGNRVPGVSVTTGSWLGPPGVDVGAAAASSLDPRLAGLKRPASEALYPQTVLGAHNTIGQSEAWLSTNLLAKRPRFENASSLPIYPQRPGEKDCAHYMLTRTCKFGDSCKFDHPIWVPEGGIPDWKEVPLIATSESLPERPGEPDCPGVPESADVSVLPQRPSELPCAFYVKTGTCKFGATCKFHHPKDILIPSAGQENGSGEQIQAINDEMAGDLELVKPLFTPALLHNSKGLPIRP
ncbi:unnamed protein product, partial [Ilex paraguariensis]